MYNCFYTKHGEINVKCICQMQSNHLIAHTILPQSAKLRLCCSDGFWWSFLSQSGVKNHPTADKLPMNLRNLIQTLVFRHGTLTNFQHVQFDLKIMDFLRFLLLYDSGATRFSPIHKKGFKENCIHKAVELTKFYDFAEEIFLSLLPVTHNSSVKNQVDPSWKALVYRHHFLSDEIKWF